MQMRTITVPNKWSSICVRKSDVRQKLQDINAAGHCPSGELRDWGPRPNKNCARSNFRLCHRAGTAYVARFHFLPPRSLKLFSGFQNGSTALPPAQQTIGNSRGGESVAVRVISP